MSDDADTLALVNGQVDAVERHEAFIFLIGFCADLGVGILLVADARPPGLNISLQGSAADRAEAVSLFEPCDLNGNILFASHDDLL